MSQTEYSVSPIKSVIEGIFLTVIVTLISVLIFAFIAKTALLGKGVITAVNQFIKIISIFVGCLFSIKGSGGIIKGGIIGLISCGLTYLLFLLFSSSVSFGLSFILDLVFYLIVGAISGIITVNVRG
jgi:putative membrane protein (TIGR04086 family)